MPKSTTEPFATSDIDRKFLRGVLVDKNLVRIPLKSDNGTSFWKINNADLVDDEIKKNCIGIINESTPLVGMWFAEKAVTQGSETRSWYVGMIREVSWPDAKHGPTFKVVYPGLDDATRSFCNVNVHKNIALADINADNGVFSMSTDRKAAGKMVNGNMIIFNHSLLHLHETHDKIGEMSFALQSADLTQRSLLLSEKERLFTETAEKLKAALLKFESDRKDASSIDTATATGLEEKLADALKLAKEHQERLEAMQSKFDSERETIQKDSEKQISDLQQKLDDAAAQLQHTEEASADLEKTSEANRISTAAAHGERVRQLTQQVMETNAENAEWRSRIEQLEANIHNEGGDDTRVSALEQDLSNAHEELRRFESRYEELDRDRVQNRDHTDDILRKHEEFVEQAGIQSSNLLRALEESESRYAEFHIEVTHANRIHRSSTEPTIHNNIVHELMRSMGEV